MRPKKGHVGVGVLSRAQLRQGGVGGGVDERSISIKSPFPLLDRCPLAHVTGGTFD